MATEETQKFCPSCQRNVLARRKGTSHVLHLLLTIVTVGCWAIVWLGTSAKFGGWRCAFCGSNKVEAPRQFTA